MKYCIKCGNECVDEAVVCVKCGCAFPKLKANQEENPAWGILSIIFGALGGIIGLVFSILGLATYKSKENIKKCYIGIGLFCLWMALSIILTVTKSWNWW